MIATHTKASPLESIRASLETNVTARLLTLYVPAAALVALLFWLLADWNVYLQDSEGLFKPNFRLTGLEQLTVSAVVGALIAGVPFGLPWLFRSRAAGGFWLGRLSFLLGISGAALGWTLFYLAWRVGGDIWTHFQFLGIDGLSYLILSLATLFVSQSAALALGLFSWSKPFGKAAVAVAATSALLFVGILAVPFVLMHLLAS
jgi:hypothetical protein